SLDRNDDRLRVEWLDLGEIGKIGKIGGGFRHGARSLAETFAKQKRFHSSRQFRGVIADPRARKNPRAAHAQRTPCMRRAISGETKTKSAPTPRATQPMDPNTAP